MRKALAAACCLALAAGCGSDDETASTLSQDELVAKAETACETFSRGLGELPDDHGQGAEVGEITKRAADAALRELGGADLPAELEQLAGRIREAGARAGRLEQFARAGNDSTMHSMQTDVDTARSEASEIGTRIGARGCADVAPADSGH